MSDKIRVTKRNGDTFLHAPFSNRDSDFFEMGIKGREEWGELETIEKISLTVQSARWLKERLEEYIIRYYARREEDDNDRERRKATDHGRENHRT